MSNYAELIERFARGPAELAEAIAGLSPEQLTARPGPGAWSIHEVVIHLADSDAIALDRMKRVLTQENPTLLNADETAYIRELHPHEQSLEDALELFKLGRRQFARVLRRLPPEAFTRHGTHELAGRLTLADLLTGYTEHVPHHARFICEKRTRLG